MSDQPMEVLNYDHLDQMEIFTKQERYADELHMMYINNLGRLKEGNRFNIYHYGYVNFSLQITLAGKGVLSWRGREVELRRGDAVFHNNYEYSCISTNDEEWSFVHFDIYGEPCYMFQNLWNGDGVGVIHLDDLDRIDEYYRQISRVILVPGIESDLEIHRQLNDMLVSCLLARSQADKSPRTPPFPAWVSEATAYISDNYRDNALITALADRFFLNRTYFGRQFKRYTGKTPKEYQTLCRMNEAASLLRGTALSIAEVAEQCGFASQSLFAKVFHATYGQTPTEYRKNR